MTALTWDSRIMDYPNGVSKGVLYLPGMNGIAWNGLVSAEEIQSEVNTRHLYFEGNSYALVQSGEDFSLRLSAFTYPGEFESWIGYFDNQSARKFDFSYQTGDSTHFQLHLVYGAAAKPAGRIWRTNSDVVELEPFQWDITTTPQDYPGIRPTAHVMVDSAIASTASIDELCERLYGTSATVPSMPTIEEVYNIFAGHVSLQIIDNGDGTWTAVGDDSAISIALDGTFTITATSIEIIDFDTYQISNEI